MVGENQDVVPSGWMGLSLLVRHAFSFGTESLSPLNCRSAFISSADASESEDEQFGAFVQCIDAREFVGKIIHFSGMTLKNEPETDAAIFLEINDQFSNLLASIYFKEFTAGDWEKFSLKLFVPSASCTISFGGMLRSAGKLWFNSLEFCSEVADAPLADTLAAGADTAYEKPSTEYCSEPRNLSFMVEANGVPEFWRLWGRHTEAFALKVHHGDQLDECYTTLQCEDPKYNYSAATVEQTIDAKHLRGRTIEFSGMLNADDVCDKAGMFLRMNGPNRLLENMDNNPVTGTTQWAPYKVQLDVPLDAESISFGYQLQGKGKISVKQLGFKDLGLGGGLLTDASSPRKPHRAIAPVNLSLS